GGVQALFEIVGFELDFPLRRAPALRRPVAPDAGVAVGLQLHADRQLVRLIGARLLRLTELALEPGDRLHVMTDFVCDDISLRKIPWRAEALPQLAEEAQIEIDAAIGGAVERTGRALSE